MADSQIPIFQNKAKLKTIREKSLNPTIQKVNAIEFNQNEILNKIDALTQEVHDNEVVINTNVNSIAELVIALRRAELAIQQTFSHCETDDALKLIRYYHSGSGTLLGTCDLSGMFAGTPSGHGVIIDDGTSTLVGSKSKLSFPGSVVRVDPDDNSKAIIIPTARGSLEASVGEAEPQQIIGLNITGNIADTSIIPATQSLDLHIPELELQDSSGKSSKNPKKVVFKDMTFTKTGDTVEITDLAAHPVMVQKGSEPPHPLTKIDLESNTLVQMVPDVTGEGMELKVPQFVATIGEETKPIKGVKVDDVDAGYFDSDNILHINHSAIKVGNESLMRDGIHQIKFPGATVAKVKDTVTVTGLKGIDVYENTSGKMVGAEKLVFSKPFQYRADAGTKGVTLNPFVVKGEAGTEIPIKGISMAGTPSVTGDFLNLSTGGGGGELSPQSLVDILDAPNSDASFSITGSKVKLTADKKKERARILAELTSNTDPILQPDSVIKFTKTTPQDPTKAGVKASLDEDGLVGLIKTISTDSGSVLVSTPTEGGKRKLRFDYDSTKEKQTIEVEGYNLAGSYETFPNTENLIMDERFALIPETDDPTRLQFKLRHEGALLGIFSGFSALVASAKLHKGEFPKGKILGFVTKASNGVPQGYTVYSWKGSLTPSADDIGKAENWDYSYFLTSPSQGIKSTGTIPTSSTHNIAAYKGQFVFCSQNNSFYYSNGTDWVKTTLDGSGASILVDGVKDDGTTLTDFTAKKLKFSASDFTVNPTSTPDEAIIQFKGVVVTDGGSTTMSSVHGLKFNGNGVVVTEEGSHTNQIANIRIDGIQAKSVGQEGEEKYVPISKIEVIGDPAYSSIDEDELTLNIQSPACSADNLSQLKTKFPPTSNLHRIGYTTDDEKLHWSDGSNWVDFPIKSDPTLSITGKKADGSTATFGLISNLEVEGNLEIEEASEGHVKLKYKSKTNFIGVFDSEVALFAAAYADKDIKFQKGHTAGYVRKNSRVIESQPTLWYTMWFWDMDKTDPTGDEIKNRNNWSFKSKLGAAGYCTMVVGNHTDFPDWNPENISRDPQPKDYTGQIVYYNALDTTKSGHYWSDGDKWNKLASSGKGLDPDSFIGMLDPAGTVKATKTTVGGQTKLKLDATGGGAGTGILVTGKDYQSSSEVDVSETVSHIEFGDEMDTEVATESGGSFVKINPKGLSIRGRKSASADPELFEKIKIVEMGSGHVVRSNIDGTAKVDFGINLKDGVGTEHTCIENLMLKGGEITKETSSGREFYTYEPSTNVQVKANGAAATKVQQINVTGDAVVSTDATSGDKTLSILSEKTMFIADNVSNLSRNYPPDNYKNRLGMTTDSGAIYLSYKYEGQSSYRWEPLTSPADVYSLADLEERLPPRPDKTIKYIGDDYKKSRYVFLTSAATTVDGIDLPDIGQEDGFLVNYYSTDHTQTEFGWIQEFHGSTYSWIRRRRSSGDSFVWGEWEHIQTSRLSDQNHSVLICDNNELYASGFKDNDVIPYMLHQDPTSNLISEPKGRFKFVRPGSYKLSFMTQFTWNTYPTTASDIVEDMQYYTFEVARVVKTGDTETFTTIKQIQVNDVKWDETTVSGKKIFPMVKGVVSGVIVSQSDIDNPAVSFVFRTAIGNKTNNMMKQMLMDPYKCLVGIDPSSSTCDTAHNIINTLYRSLGGISFQPGYEVRSQAPTSGQTPRVFGDTYSNNIIG